MPSFSALRDIWTDKNNSKRDAPPEYAAEQAHFFGSYNIRAEMLNNGVKVPKQFKAVLMSKSILLNFLLELIL